MFWLEEIPYLNLDTIGPMLIWFANIYETKVNILFWVSVLTFPSTLVIVKELVRCARVCETIAHITFGQGDRSKPCQSSSLYNELAKWILEHMDTKSYVWLTIMLHFIWLSMNGNCLLVDKINRKQERQLVMYNTVITIMCGYAHREYCSSSFLPFFWGYLVFWMDLWCCP